MSSRCCATIGAGFRQCCPVEVPLLQFIDSRRHPCCGGPDSAWWSCRSCSSSTVVDIPTVAQRQLGLQTARKPSAFHGCSFQQCSSQQFFRGKLITQVMSYCLSVPVTDVASPMFCGHTLHQAVSRVFAGTAMMSRCLGGGWGFEAHCFSKLRFSSALHMERQVLFGHLCCHGHGDILVMDGQCQDEFLHCTNPGLEREWINVTFRWIRQHTA